MNAELQTTRQSRLCIAVLTTVWGKHAVGGAERMAEQHARHWAQAGHAVHMVALGHDAPENTQPLLAHSVPLFQLYDPFGLQPGSNGQPRPAPQRPAWKKALWHGLDVYNPVMGHRLNQVLEQVRPDLVVTHNLQGFSVAAWHSIRRTRARHIHVIHDHSLLCPATAMTRGQQVCVKLCGSCSAMGLARRWVAPMPDVVVAPSAAVLQRHIAQGWFADPQRPRHVIPNAIANDWPQAAHGVRFAHGAPCAQEPLRFGFVGRLDESKGVDTLLDAAAHCQGHWSLRLAGPGDGLAWQREIDARGLSQRVTWVGPLPGPAAVQDFMRSCHVLLTPSRAAETFSNVVLEAACLGVPALVANSGALPERIGLTPQPHAGLDQTQGPAVMKQGPSGWMVPAGDVQAWAMAMQHCIDSPHEVQRCGDAALAWRAHHTEERVQGMWADVLAQALQGSADHGG
jgi:glycosyltransferase involved in cell wall biosynthesis